MSKPIILRIGICECTKMYKGKIDGRKFNVGTSVYIIKEVVVPETNYGKIIETVRTCHIFIDVHVLEGTPQISVHQVDFLIIDEKKYGPVFESWIEEGVSQKIVGIVGNRIPPTPKNLIRLLKIIVSYYQPEERKAWFARMTQNRREKPSRT